MLIKKHIHWTIELKLLQLKQTFEKSVSNGINYTQPLTTKNFQLNLNFEQTKLNLQLKDFDANDLEANFYFIFHSLKKDNFTLTITK